MPLRDVTLGLAIALLWGFNFVVMKVGVTELPPLVLAACRFSLAAVPLVFFVPPPRSAWRWIILFGLLFGVIKFTLLFLGLRLGMPAGLSAVVLQMQALFTALLAGVLLAERADARQIIGAVVATAGLALLAADWIGSAPLLPFVLVVAAALTWAMANIVAKRATGADPFAFTLWSSLVAAGPLVILALFVEGWSSVHTSLANMTWRGGGAILYLAYPVALWSVAVWNGLMQRHSAAAVAPFALLVPVVSLLLGHVLLGEPISRAMAAGGMLVLLGLGISMLRWKTG
jgi:O-acetylserine/cysteine efflux transporter